ncbi:MAG: CapA family protein [Dehalococcoidia bacterium]
MTAPGPILLLCGLLAACGADAVTPPSATPSAVPSARAAQPSPTVQVSPTTTPATVTLSAVGDLMLARSIGSRIESDGPSAVFDEAISSRLSGSDITAGNLEMVVSDLGYPQDKGYTFEAPPGVLSALTLAGFDVVSQANNHALDFGPEALLDTAAWLRDAGIGVAGSGPDIDSATAPVIIERNAIRIAFVSLVDTAPEGTYSRATWEASAIDPGVAWADIDSVTAAVQRAAGSADVVVAMLHFGIEYAPVPSDEQRTLAHAAIDAGASLVLGSHPHVLQEMEEYGGGLIAYSLGNFVFDGFSGSANDSAILQVTFATDGIESWQLVPVELVENGLPRLVSP